EKVKQTSNPSSSHGRPFSTSPVENSKTSNVAIEILPNKQVYNQNTGKTLKVDTYSAQEEAEIKRLLEKKAQYLQVQERMANRQVEIEQLDERIKADLENARKISNDDLNKWESFLTTAQKEIPNKWHLTGQSEQLKDAILKIISSKLLPK